MSKRTILVIEDDAPIRQGIIDALHYNGYETAEAENGETGLELALRLSYDLLLLDLILPIRDGFEILQEVRALRPSTPIILLTARGEEADRVKGLQMGADDYVVKPFSVKELLARIEAVMRRSPERPSNAAGIKLPSATVDLTNGTIQFDNGQFYELSEREAQLLRYLAHHPGRIITREEILSRVWQIDPNGIETRTIDMHIARLREKLDDHRSNVQLIETIRGKGYRFARFEDDS